MFCVSTDNIEAKHGLKVILHVQFLLYQSVHKLSVMGSIESLLTNQIKYKMKKNKCMNMSQHVRLFQWQQARLYWEKKTAS